jgi:hypothetical protein
MSVAGTNSGIGNVDTFLCAFSPFEAPNRLKRRLALRTSAKHSTSSRSCLRDFIRPMSILSILLAAAVAMWGFGYKLSLYLPVQKHSTQVSVAKMWLGPERQPGLVTSNDTKPHTCLGQSVQPELTIESMPSLSSWQALWAFPEIAFVPTGRHFLTGSRSPPPTVLSMHCRVVA